MSALVNDPDVLVDDPGFTVNGIGLDGAGTSVLGPTSTTLIDHPTTTALLDRPAITTAGPFVTQG